VRGAVAGKIRDLSPRAAVLLRLPAAAPAAAGAAMSTTEEPEPLHLRFLSRKRRHAAPTTIKCARAGCSTVRRNHFFRLRSDMKHYYDSFSVSLEDALKRHSQELNLRFIRKAQVGLCSTCWGR
jgi:hypothetical protein